VYFHIQYSVGGGFVVGLGRLRNQPLDNIAATAVQKTQINPVMKRKISPQILLNDAHFLLTASPTH
jgi:hypothetical protein